MDRPSDNSKLSNGSLPMLLGYALHVGVITAAVVVLLGGIIYLVRHGAASPHYDVFRGEPSDLRSVTGIFLDVFSLSGRGVIQLGLLLLIATPVVRVFLSLLAFLRQHDWTYVLVSLIVLSLLLYSLFWGRL